MTNTARGILLGGHTCKHSSALGTRGGRRCSCRVLEGSEEGGTNQLGSERFSSQSGRAAAGSLGVFAQPDFACWEKSNKCDKCDFAPLRQAI